MKMVDGLLQMVLETGTKKEIFVYFKSLDHVPLQGIVTAIDPNMKWILIESTDDPEKDKLCFLINFNEIIYMSYFKCNGSNINESKKSKIIKSSREKNVLDNRISH